MKRITIELEIENIDNWDVDWNNKDDAESQLIELKHEVHQAISRSCGISMNSINISKVNILIE